MCGFLRFFLGAFENCKSSEIRIGEIQEAILEDWIFRIFFSTKKVVFLETKCEKGYTWISYKKIVYSPRNDDRFPEMNRVISISHISRTGVPLIRKILRN